MIDWFYWHVNLSKAILCQEVRDWISLYVHILHNYSFARSYVISRISILNISIRLIDGTLISTTNPGQSEHGNEVMAMKGYSTLPRSPELEPQHQMQFNIIPGHSFWGFLFLYMGRQSAYFKLLRKFCSVWHGEIWLFSVLTVSKWSLMSSHYPKLRNWWLTIRCRREALAPCSGYSQRILSLVYRAFKRNLKHWIFHYILILTTHVNMFVHTNYFKTFLQTHV